MANIKYKDINPSHYKNAVPRGDSNLRKSVGFEKMVGEYYFLKVESLIPYKNQARQIFNDEEINLLADTIREHGIRQPLTVIPSEDKKDFFEVVSGERRLKGAIIVGLKVVPCIIIKDRDKAAEIALIENIQRSDLHPIEFADAVASLMQAAKWGDASELALKIGKHVSTISEALTVSKLPEEIKKALIEKNIRSRDIIRKLTHMNMAEMKRTVGIDGKEKSVNSFSVLRITKGFEGYKIQDGGLKKLNEAERVLLKEQLKKILDIL